MAKYTIEAAHKDANKSVIRKSEMETSFIMEDVLKHLDEIKTSLKVVSTKVDVIGAQISIYEVERFQHLKEGSVDDIKHLFDYCKKRLELDGLLGDKTYLEDTIGEYEVELLEINKQLYGDTKDSRKDNDKKQEKL